MNMSDESNDRKINMKMLAKELNLSIATVSRALKDSYEVSDQTKARVKEAAARFNYVVNTQASSLRSHKTYTLAIVVPEIGDSFFTQVINGIESVADKKKYRVLICMTHDSYEREMSVINELTNGRVDGVLISVASNTRDGDHFNALKRKGIPVVFFDRDFKEINAASVKTDDFESAYNATCHLLDKGCKKISLITVRGGVSIFSAREEGYRQALSDHHIDLGLPNIIHCANEHSADNIAMIRDHLLKARPDGLLLTVEHLSTDAYTACHLIGLKIPADIKIACFTTQLTAGILNPALTTIQQPAFEMGQKAAELLIEYLTYKYIQLENQHLVLPSKLILRDSTGLR